jgi:aminomethyltransferase
MDVRKTNLYEEHQKLDAKLMAYSGWEMPIQYKGIKEEHKAVREKAGIFDVSHMGEVKVKGNQAEDFVQYLVTNDVKSMKENSIVYAMMCYENGGIVDDLLVYKYNKDDFLLVINAANVSKDFDWMKKVKEEGKFDIELNNISDDISEVALQGPKAQEILQKIADKDLGKIKFFEFYPSINIDGIDCIVSRSGYTGEDGFEIYTENDNIKQIWKKILEVGEEYGIEPVGLGARDTLRFEANLPLYGNELSKDITPIEAGYNFAVKLEGDDFSGRDALVKQKEEGLKRKIVGFELLGRGIPRHEYPVVNEKGKEIGFVTTGYKSITLGKPIGLAMVDIEYSKLDTEIFIQIRKNEVKAKVIKRSFLKKNYK